MIYKNFITATFNKREKRFIAYCTLKDGINIVAHVRNTGRCAELLIPGVTVFLEHAPHSGRKTDYTLVAVQKGKLIINIDSQSPNQIAYESILDGTIKLPGLREKITFSRREYTYKDSRYDIYLETKSKKVLIEVKGVTLEEEGVVKFPDAPTLRGIKHLRGLSDAIGDGFVCYVVFIIQLGGNIKYFTTNDVTHPQFKAEMIKAQQSGVKMVAYDSIIKNESITADKKIPIRL